MRAPLLLLLLSLPAACQAQGPAPIVLDGRFDDWAGVPAAVVDEADAPGAEVDFRTVRIADEPHLVHILIDLGEGREINVQRLDGCARLLLDGDGDPATGSSVHGLPGIDVIISLTPPPPPEGDSGARNRRGMGVGLESTTYEGDPDDEARPPLSPYDIGIALAPTYADRFVELRIERGAGDDRRAAIATATTPPPSLDASPVNVNNRIVPAVTALADGDFVVVSGGLLDNL